MNQKEVVINFCGYLKYETIGDILSDLKEQISKYNLKVVIHKKIVTVTIESLENMYKYYLNVKDPRISNNSRPPIFMVEKTENEFLIHTGNTLFKKDVPVLVERLEIINNRTKDELKELYKNIITDGQFSMKGGAGLGFIEMAKMSGHKLDFYFEELDDDVSYFNLAVKITLN